MCCMHAHLVVLEDLDHADGADAHDDRGARLQRRRQGRGLACLLSADLVVPTEYRFAFGLVSESEIRL